MPTPTPVPQDCVWSEWSLSSQCEFFTGTCGNGSYPLVRNLLTPASNGGDCLCVSHQHSTCPPGTTQDFDRNITVPCYEECDECALRTSTCEQVCVNGTYPEGSFTCGCYPGFRLLNETHCRDVDECQELGPNNETLHDCEDECVDGKFPYGSYTCGCTPPKIQLNPQDRTCATPTCGNGERDDGEECDYGAPGCQRDCKCGPLFTPKEAPAIDCAPLAPVLRCGDGRRDNYSSVVEECDSGLGCDSNCKCITPQFTVLPTGVDCGLVVTKGGCGDGILDAGEQCESPQFNPRCQSDCTCAPGSVPTSSGQCQLVTACGNGRLEIGEECDSQTVACVNCICDRANSFIPRTPMSLTCAIATSNSSLPPPLNAGCAPGEVRDKCGECRYQSDPEFNACVDCRGIINGTYRIDDCGVCRNSLDASFGNCSQPESCPSPALVDMCGSCLLPGSPGWDVCVDCKGVPFGEHAVDLCGNCLLRNSTEWNSCPRLGCDLVLDSGFRFDDCGMCRSPLDPNFDSCQQAAPAMVSPLLSCWEELASPNPLRRTVTAFLGWYNEGTEAATIPIGCPNGSSRPDCNRLSFIFRNGSTAVFNYRQPEYFPVGFSAPFPLDPLRVQWDFPSDEPWKLSWALGGKEVVIDPQDPNTRCPQGFYALVSFALSDSSNPSSDLSDFLTPARLIALRLGIANMAQLDPNRIIISIPLDNVNILNISITPPHSNDGNKKRQAGVAQTVEISTAVAAQKLLQPTDSSKNTGLSSSLAENGIDNSESDTMYSRPKTVQGSSIPPPPPPVAHGHMLLLPQLMLAMCAIFSVLVF